MREWGDESRSRSQRRPARQRRHVEWDFFYTPVSQLIEQGLARGHNLREIAECLDTSKRSVERWAKQAGIRTPCNPGRKRRS